MTTATQSAHLSNLLGTKQGSVDAQIVFIDIVSYSRRKTTIQREVVQALQSDIEFSLNEVSKLNINYVQENNINFSNDVVKIPTGDGAAIAFSFGGLQSAGLDFANIFLKKIYDDSTKPPCDRFLEQGWCNCHSYYKARIGINEGKCIFYIDLNKQVNVAGTCINDAARIMDSADGQQILLSESAHSNLIDLSSDINLEDKFSTVGSVKVKHGKEIQIEQYVGTEEPYINREKPMKIAINDELLKNMSRMGMSSIDGFSSGDNKKMLELTRSMGDIMEQIAPMLGLKPVINVDSVIMNKKDKRTD